MNTNFNELEAIKTSTEENFEKVVKDAEEITFTRLLSSKEKQQEHEKEN